MTAKIIVKKEKKRSLAGMTDIFVEQVHNSAGTTHGCYYYQFLYKRKNVIRHLLPETVIPSRKNKAYYC